MSSRGRDVDTWSVVTVADGDKFMLRRDGVGYLADIASVRGDAPYWDLAATTAPTVNEDSNATIARAVGSRVIRVDKGIVFDCLDATDGAAVWTRVPPAIGNVTGTWRPLFTGTSQVGTVAADPTLIYVRPFTWFEKVTVTSLPVWVTGTDTGKGVKTAIYKSSEVTTGYGRPVGAPLMQATGVLDNAYLSGSSVSGGGTLWPGAYWFAIKIESTTARFHTPASLARDVEAMIGRSVSTGSANAVQHLSMNGTSYATAFPTMTGSETWSDVYGQGMPYGWIGT